LLNSRLHLRKRKFNLELEPPPVFVDTRLTGDGGIGAALSIADLRTLQQGGAKGPERIAKHLTMMLAGTIATITAFVVTNVPVRAADALQHLNLGFIVWLAPTVVITPIIIVWNRKIRAGKRPKGMPELP
jgi:hypothetical protein